MDPETIATYNQMAKIYDEETADFWEHFPRTFLDTFIQLSGKRILNVGSGPGRDGLLLQEVGKEIVCLDASEAMVELSLQRGLQSVLGNFDNIPFEDESFDGVWSYTALLHTPKANIDKPFSEIYRVLKPGGFFALGMIEGEGELHRPSSEMSLLRWFSFYTKEELETIAARHHFTAVFFDNSLKPRSKRYLHFIFKK